MSCQRVPDLRDVVVVVVLSWGKFTRNSQEFIIAGGEFCEHFVNSYFLTIFRTTLFTSLVFHSSSPHVDCYIFSECELYDLQPLFGISSRVWELEIGILVTDCSIAIHNSEHDFSYRLIPSTLNPHPPEKAS